MDLEQSIAEKKALLNRLRPLDIAGKYAELARFVRTESARNSPAASFETHRRLVDIPPFNELGFDPGGYPGCGASGGAAGVCYGIAQAEQGVEEFETLLYERLDARLEDYLCVLGGTPAAQQ